MGRGVESGLWRKIRYGPGVPRRSRGGTNVRFIIPHGFPGVNPPNSGGIDWYRRAVSINIREEQKLELENRSAEGCGYKSGALPGCAPLAVAFVPMQQRATPAYDSGEALARGTLFPGLDLPFMNMVNKTPEQSLPLRELMALDFVLDEMELYLDTHRKDAEAFATYQSMLKLAREGRERYTALYGPVTQTDLLGAKSYTWLNAPWPWDAGKED